MLLEDLNASLPPGERDTVAPVFCIDPKDIDARNSSLERKGNFLVCRVMDSSGSRCPFEFHFGRGTSQGRFNFFVGLSAALYNYEPCEDETARKEIADDIARFLTSTVRCGQRVTEKDVVRAIYCPSKFVVDGMQIQLAYKSHAWPLFRYRKVVLEYDQWITDETRLTRGSLI